MTKTVKWGSKEYPVLTLDEATEQVKVGKTAIQAVDWQTANLPHRWVAQWDTKQRYVNWQCADSDKLRKPDWTCRLRGELTLDTAHAILVVWKVNCISYT